MKDQRGPRSCLDFFSHGAVGAEMTLRFSTEPGLPKGPWLGVPGLQFSRGPRNLAQRLSAL